MHSDMLSTDPVKFWKRDILTADRLRSMKMTKNPGVCFCMMRLTPIKQPDSEICQGCFKGKTDKVFR